MSERRFVTRGGGVPRWTSLISHALLVGKTGHVGGKPSASEDVRHASGSVREEAGRCFEGFFAALRVAGFSREKVVRVGPWTGAYRLPWSTTTPSFVRAGRPEAPTGRPRPGRGGAGA